MSACLRVLDLSGNQVWGSTDITTDVVVSKVWAEAAEALGQPKFMVRLSTDERIVAPQQTPFPEVETWPLESMDDPTDLRATVLAEPDRFALLQEIIPMCKPPYTGSPLSPDHLADEVAKISSKCECAQLPEDILVWLEVLMVRGLVLAQGSHSITGYHLQQPDEFEHGPGILRLWGAACIGGTDCCESLWVDVCGAGGVAGGVWLSSIWDDDDFGSVHALLAKGTFVADSMSEFFRRWAVECAFPARGIDWDPPPSPPPLAPGLKWAQRRGSVLLTVENIRSSTILEDEVVSLKSDSLSFSCRAAGQRYAFTVEFFADVRTGHCTWHARRRIFFLRKEQEGTWPSLMKGGKKVSWIEADWHKWGDSDDEDWNEDFDTTGFEKLEQ